MRFHIILTLISIVFYSCKTTISEPDIDLSSGTLERIDSFKSNYVSVRNIDIWLPDNYSDEKSYSVLYMHDGQMLFDSTTTWNKQEWGVDETMKTLIETNQIKESIIVGIWNTEFRHSEYFPQKPFFQLDSITQDSILNLGRSDAPLFKKGICSDKYLKFIVEELKPTIDKKYSTLPTPEHTHIGGSSMGGLISMYAVCEYPNIFSSAICMSTHWIGIFGNQNNPIPNQFMQYLDKKLPSPENHRFYFDYGTATLDSFYEPYQLKVDSIFLNHNYKENYTSLKFDGDDHSENAWKSRLDIPFKSILRKD